MWKARCASEEADVSAQIGSTGQAVVAPQARSGWIYSDTLTGLDFCYIWAHSDDLSGNLVTEHHRFAHREIADSPFVIVMQVRPANPTSAESYQHLALLGLGFGAILNF
jgi:hypothetical protein